MKRFALDRFSYSAVPFSIITAWFLFSCAPILILLYLATSEKISRTGGGIFFAAVLLFNFVGPAIYSKRPTPFQGGRTPIGYFALRGVGPLFYYNYPSWVLIFTDGIEVRVFYHCFFIPYEHVTSPPGKKGFFHKHLRIKTDIPGFPGDLRLYSAGASIDKMLGIINIYYNMDITHRELTRVTKKNEVIKNEYSNN